MKMLKYLWVILLPLLVSCSSGPRPIDYGKEDCTFCKMTIVEKQFGCQVVNTKGKQFDFDDLRCLVGYLQSGMLPDKEIAAIYVPEYTGNNELLPVAEMYFVESVKLHSPMMGNVAAFASQDSAQHFAEVLNGKLVTWETIRKANE